MTVSPMASVAGSRVPAQHNSRAEVGQLQSWLAVRAEVDQPEAMRAI